MERVNPDNSTLTNPRNPALAWLRAALEDFYTHDRELLRLQASELAVTFRLAHYLALRAEADAEWVVDAEYDRQGEDGMRKVRDVEKTTYMRPDLVVHQRGNNEQNLLYVEVKRIWRHNKGDHDDLEKARKAVIQLGYQAGVVLGLTNDDAAPNCFSPKWTVYTLKPPDRDSDKFRETELVPHTQAVFTDAELARLQASAEHRRPSPKGQYR